MADEEQIKEKSLSKNITWNPLLGVLLVLGIYVVSQVVGLVVLIYPLLMHWSSTRSSNWLSNSIYAQFAYLIVVESFTVISVIYLLKYFRTDKKAIGLRKPKWKDLLWAVIAAPIYYLIYIVVVAITSGLDKGLNVSEGQNVGFNHVHGLAELTVTFISLVILPPIAEEILVRGFLYSSLRKGLPQLAAALLTSVIFASAHLPEGTSGLLWIGFIDTFILSMVLVYLREKTGGLWSGMIVHALKNGLAFFVLYASSIYAFHIF
jgi:membrane protease YdiL (CAAX protease family)